MIYLGGRMGSLARGLYQRQWPTLKLYSQKFRILPFIKMGVCNEREFKPPRLYVDPKSKALVNPDFGDEAHYPSFFVRRSDYNTLIQEYEQKGRMWEDSSFRPCKTSLGKIEDLTEQPQWKRISEIKKDPVFLVEDYDPTDILKGTNENYILAAAAAVAETPQRISRLFPHVQNYNKSGAYMVRLMVNGVVEEVTVDDYVPVTKAGTPIFSDFNKNEFWPLILEKAIAKTQGSYESILSGTTSLVLRAITFSPVSEMVVAPECADQIKQALTRAMAKRFVVCGTSHDQQTDTQVPPNRTFTVLAFNPDHSVLLRNTNLDKESDAKMKALDCSIDKQNSSLFENRLPSTDKSFTKANRKGEYNISWPNFLWKFSSIEIAHLDQNYNQAPVQYKSIANHAKYFAVTVNAASPIRLTATLCREKNSPARNPRIRLILAKIINEEKGELEYIGSASKCSQSTFFQLPNVEPGKYLVYSKIEKDGRAVLMTQLYHLVPEVQEVNREFCKGFLEKVMLSHAKKSPEKKYLNPEKTDWVMSNLLLKEAGLGYIACSIASDKCATIEGYNHIFENEGFRTKSPFKKEDKFKIEVREGQQTILIAKAKRGSKLSEAVFPPEMSVFYGD